MACGLDMPVKSTTVRIASSGGLELMIGVGQVLRLYSALRCVECVEVMVNGVDLYEPWEASQATLKSQTTRTQHGS